MLMLDGDESLWRDEYDDSPLEPAAAVRPKAANSQDRRPARGAKLEEDASLDKYLGRMPGVGDMDSEESVMNEMLVSFQTAPAIWRLWGFSNVWHLHWVLQMLPDANDGAGCFLRLGKLSDAVRCLCNLNRAVAASRVGYLRCN